MNAEDDNGTSGGFASPPCFMHELDPACSTGDDYDAQTAIDVARWRISQRKQLIQARMAVPAVRREAATNRIAARLDDEIGDVRDRCVAIFWPCEAEPDLRAWAATVIERGGSIALPVVVAKARPLVFRLWAPGDRLEEDVRNLPALTEGEETEPDIVVSPLVGYDDAGYRLGYGGGFYDRTLATMNSRPRTIGVGFTLSRLPTIFPQWHDIAMDRLIVEEA